MSCRPIIRDLRSRDHAICRSCLLRLVKQPAAASISRFSPFPPFSPFSSQASGRGDSRKTRPDPSSSSRPSRQRHREELAQYVRQAKLQRELAKEPPPGADADADADAGFSVRYFEQDDKTRTELADEKAFGESLARLDASEIGGGISDFEAGLRTADERDAFKSVLDGIGAERLDSVSSAQDLERMIAKLEIYTKSIDKEIKDVAADLPQEVLDELLRDIPELPAMDELEHNVQEQEQEQEQQQQQASRPGRSSSSRRPNIPQIPEHSFSVAQIKRVNKLNHIIRTTWSESRRKQGLGKTSVHNIYRAYHAARFALALHWGQIPRDVWDYLWNAFATDNADNVHRLSHISRLARDMDEARVALKPHQQLVAIEAVFVDGWEDKAIDNWKRCVGTLGAPNAGADADADADETFQNFWELGVRMFCRVGDTQQAERAVNKLLDRNLSPRILMTLIRTCCEQHTPEGHDRAWTTYRRMRELLGADMRLTDYDQVVAYFLTANHIESALYAFVDMMSNGQIDLSNQKALPTVIANKFFFGKWLKRLIGAGNLDGAYSVVRFMEREKIEGASVQVNGLLGAWLRSGGDQDVEKADILAWRMIETRIRFANDRASALASSSSSSASIIFKPPVTGLPRATLETFYLLADNYRQRGLHHKLSMLWDAFREAGLEPDAVMMNQLLESHISRGQWADATALYRSLAGSPSPSSGALVVPDPFTFSALWKTLDINRLHFIPDERLPDAARAARAMFREMMRFRHIFPAGRIDAQLARKILHSFRRLKDQAGFLLALMALRHQLGFLPADTLALELMLNTTKLAWETPTHRRKLLLAKRSLDFALQDVPGEQRGEALYRFLQQRNWAEFDAGGRDRVKILEAMAEEMGVAEEFALQRERGDLPINTPA